jgi:hypothetical protein
VFQCSVRCHFAIHAPPSFLIILLDEDFEEKHRVVLAVRAYDPFDVSLAAAHNITPRRPPFFPSSIQIVDH